MIRSLIAALALAALPAAAADAPTPVRELDIARYAGTWHEVARLPNRFEARCVRDVTATYAVKDDGRLSVTNACRQADGSMQSVTGEARRAGELPSQLEVRFAPAWLSFLPFVWADYWVIALDPDYRWAVVGGPDRDYLWFLAREPAVDDTTLATMKERARAMGYDLAPLVLVPPQR